MLVDSLALGRDLLRTTYPMNHGGADGIPSKRALYPRLDRHAVAPCSRENRFKRVLGQDGPAIVGAKNESSPVALDAVAPPDAHSKRSRAVIHEAELDLGIIPAECFDAGVRIVNSWSVRFHIYPDSPRLDLRENNNRSDTREEKEEAEDDGPDEGRRPPARLMVEQAQDRVQQEVAAGGAADQRPADSCPKKESLPDSILLAVLTEVEGDLSRFTLWPE